MEGKDGPVERVCKAFFFCGVNCKICSPDYDKCRCNSPDTHILISIEVFFKPKDDETPNMSDTTFYLFLAA